MNKVYLGDSVYAEFTNYGDVILTTENGFRPSNSIVLEPGVMLALTTFYQSEAENRKKELAKEKVL